MNTSREADDNRLKFHRISACLAGHAASTSPPASRLPTQQQQQQQQAQQQQQQDKPKSVPQQGSQHEHAAASLPGLRKLQAAPSRDLPSWQQKQSPQASSQQKDPNSLTNPSPTTQQLVANKFPAGLKLEERIDAARLQAAHDASPSITLNSSREDIQKELSKESSSLADVSQGGASQKIEVIPDASHQLPQEDERLVQSAQHKADVQLQQARLHGDVSDADLGVANPDSSPTTDMQKASDKRQLVADDALETMSKPKGPRVDGEGIEIKVDSIGTLTVLAMTLGMAGVSAIGALPFFFVGSLSREWTGLANAIACGVMLAASFDLVHEGQPYGGHLVILGVVIGES